MKFKSSTDYNMSVNVQFYKIKVVNSALEEIHNMGQVIWEIFIPHEGIIVNELSGCFTSKGPRESVDGVIEKIEVPSLFVIECLARLESNESFEIAKNEVFDQIKEQHGFDKYDDSITSTPKET